MWPANVLLIFQVGVSLLVVVAFFSSLKVFSFRNVVIFPGFVEGICWKAQNGFSSGRDAN